ncbi:MAG: methyltransferase domain-containing protein, partial [Rhabdochlamydiaceae bacterium]
MKVHKCRFCNAELKHTFVDLGMSPLSNSFLKPDELDQMEPFYPLHVFTCNQCLLVQLEESETPEKIFSDYAYFSSYSKTWLDHAKNYVDMMITRWKLNEKSQVIEIASNDGYLLQYFKQSEIPVLGIEPAVNVANVSLEKGINTLVKFFGEKTANELVNNCVKADLLLGNNVLAHVPNLNDFVRGLKILLKPKGVITMEFPHLLNLIKQNQFDTIYHEHFSYFSLYSVQKIFLFHGLQIFDVDELPTHGGSLRIYAQHKENNPSISEKLIVLLKNEEEFGLHKISTYETFFENVKKVKRNLLDKLIAIKNDNKKIVGYGAAAKGNTLLNYCGIGHDFIEYVVDRNPHKQGLYLPGTHIHIESPEKIQETKPDYLLILPWNLKDEIMSQMSSI